MIPTPLWRGCDFVVSSEKVDLPDGVTAAVAATLEGLVTFSVTFCTSSSAQITIDDISVFILHTISIVTLFYFDKRLIILLLVNFSNQH